MSDIGLDFAWWEWLAIVAIAGWPGLAAGALIGALAFRRRRILAAIVLGVLGCLVVAWTRMMS